MDLGHGMIQNPAAEVTEVVEYLVACEKTLASLYTLADCLISWQVNYYFGAKKKRLKRRFSRPARYGAIGVCAVLYPETVVTNSARDRRHRYNDICLYALSPVHHLSPELLGCVSSLHVFFPITISADCIANRRF